MFLRIEGGGDVSSGLAFSHLSPDGYRKCESGSYVFSGGQHLCFDGVEAGKRNDNYMIFPQGA